MPRRPDVPCAGSCGKLMWRGRGSLPPGKAMCHPCRSDPKRAKIKSCSACTAGFEVRIGAGRTRSTCSDACAAAAVAAGVRRNAARMTLRPCADCSISTTRRGHVPLCLPCAKARRSAHYRRKCAIRRGAAAVGVSLTIEQLGERDGWRCHLCQRKVDPNLRAPHPRSRSFDHLIPVSRGGTDAPENLRLAHLRCNVSRGNRGTVQLLLVG